MYKFERVSYGQDINAHEYLLDQDGNVNSDFPDLTLFQIVKRAPVLPSYPPEDLFVSRSSNVVVLQKRALSLLVDDKITEFAIHALGAAVEKGIDLALWIQEHAPERVGLGPTTDSVKIVDDFEPLYDGLAPLSRVRINSAVHIRIIKTKADKKVRS